MDISELRSIAEQTRFMRQVGFSLLVSSAILAAFLFVPTASTPQSEAAPSVTVATSTPADAFAGVSVEAQAAIVYDLSTGETLYAKNADAQLPLASLTKLLTVYAALTQLSPTTPITIPATATSVVAPRMFSSGETFSLAELSRLTLTASLNDGAAAIAEATAHQVNRSEIDVLSEAAASLKLSQTYAVNGSGLDVSTALSGAYGSARDLARLAGALVEASPEIAQATTESVIRARAHGGKTFTAKNTDPIVLSLPHLLLSKTGYTDLAGGNLALVLDVGINHPVAIVILGSSINERFTDGNALVAATLAHFAHLSSL